MVDSLDDAVNLLVIEVTRPLATSLGATETATEWGLRLSVGALVRELQERVADAKLFDRVLELVDAYRRTNVDAAAETCFSPASTALADSLLDGVFGAARSSVTKEIGDAAQLPASAAASVLCVAAGLLLRSLEPEPSYETLEATRSEDRHFELAPHPPVAPPSAPRESTLANAMNDAAPERGKARSLRLLLPLFAIAAIAAVGLTWHLWSDRHPSRESASAPIKEAAPPVGDAAAIKTAQDTPPAQAQQAPPASQKQSPHTAFNEARTQPLEDVAGTPTQQPVSPLVTAEEASGLRQAESILRPAQTAAEAHRDVSLTKLPNGLELSIPESGGESQLLGFLREESPHSGEFNLDGIAFDHAKAALKSSSKGQLQNLAKILKAYPNTKITINSYTDNLGEKAHNLKLSRERANNVLLELTRMGVDKSRITARGFGEEHPIASNSSEEGRKQNRRISLSVTAR